MVVPFRDRSTGELVDRPRALELLEKYLKECGEYHKVFPASWGFKCVLKNQRPFFIRVKMKGSEYKNFSYSFSEIDDEYDEYIHVADFDEVFGYLLAYETGKEELNTLLSTKAFKTDDCYLLRAKLIKEKSKIIDFRF